MHRDRWIKISFYFIAIAVVQELLFRICFPLPEIENLNRIDLDVNVLQETHRIYQRDQDWYWQSSLDTEARFVHRMNRYGFRDQEWCVTKPPDVRRILMIGDSFVEGVMSSQDQTIPAYLHQLSGSDQLEVFNCGLTGRGLSEYLQVFADLIPIYRPEMVWVCLYANDLGTSMPLIPEHYLQPDYFNPFVPRIWELIQQARTYGPVHFRWFNAPLSFFDQVPDQDDPHSAPASIGQISSGIADAVHAGTFNPFRINAFSKELKALPSEPELGEFLPFIKFFGDKFGTKVVIVYLPSRNQITRYYYPYERALSTEDLPDSLDLTTNAYQIHQQVLLKQCNELGIKFLDLTMPLRSKEEEGVHLYWNYDEHMRSVGYRTVAELLWKWMQQNPGWGNPDSGHVKDKGK